MTSVISPTWRRHASARAHIRASVAKGIEQFLYAGQSESRTQWSGLMLAKAIEQALSPGFFPGLGLIHILGHSHGSKVATVATQALQLAGIPVSHLTLLESPEGGPTFGGSSLHASGLGNAENFNWYYLHQLNLTRTPVTGTESQRRRLRGQLLLQEGLVMRCSRRGERC